MNSTFDNIYYSRLFCVSRKIHQQISNEPAEFEMVETYPSASKVLELLNSQELADASETHRTKLWKTLSQSELNDENGLDVSVTYSNKPLGCTKLYGRRYTGGRGLQGVSGWIRAEILCDTCIDLDIAKAYPSIYMNLCRVIGMPCPCITAFATDWKNVVKKLKAMMDPERSRDYLGIEKDKRIKEEVHAVFNGRNYTQVSRNGTQKPIFKSKVVFLEDLKKEIETLSNIMKTIPPFDEAYNHLKKQKEEKENEKDEHGKKKHPYNIEGAFVSYFSQYFERVIMTVCEKYLKREKHDVVSFIHDGNIVRENVNKPLDSCKQRNVVDLEKLNEYIAHETDFRIEFTKKPLTMGEKMISAEHPTCRPKRSEFDGAEIIEPTLLEEKHYVRDLEFTENTRILMIDAAMGLGKSTALKRFFLQQPESVRILFITCRIRQARDLKYNLNQDGYNLGFKCYNDDDLADKIGLSKYPRLICQYESLWKLSNTYKYSDIGHYDYVVLDEVRSIVDQIGSVTNGNNYFSNFDIFKKYLKHSRVIAMDADLHYDDVVTHLFKKWAHECRRLVYTYQPLRRTMNYTPELVWWNILERSIRNQTRVAVLFAHKKILKAFYVRLKSLEYPMEKMVAWYAPDVNDNGDDDDSCQLTPMPENVNHHIKENQIRLVMFTSTITVGTDITEAFDEVYFHNPRAGSNVTICARIAFQMIGRFRNIISKNVFMSIPNNSYFEKVLFNGNDTSTDFTTSDEWIETQDKCVNYLTTTCPDLDVQNDNLSFKKVPDLLREIDDKLQKEKRLPFTTQCYKHARNSGWLNHIRIPLTRNELCDNPMVDIKEKKQNQEIMEDQNTQQVMLDVVKLNNIDFYARKEYLTKILKVKSPKESVEFQTILYIDPFVDHRHLLPDDGPVLMEMVQKKVPIYAFALLKNGMENQIVVTYLKKLFSGKNPKHVAHPPAAVFIMHWFFKEKVRIPEGLNVLSKEPHQLFVKNNIFVKEDVFQLNRLFWTARYGPTHRNSYTNVTPGQVKRPLRLLSTMCNSIGLKIQKGKYINYPDRAEKIISFATSDFQNLYLTLINDNELEQWSCDILNKNISSFLCE